MVGVGEYAGRMGVWKKRSSGRTICKWQGALGATPRMSQNQKTSETDDACDDFKSRDKINRWIIIRVDPQIATIILLQINKETPGMKDLGQRHSSHLLAWAACFRVMAPPRTSSTRVQLGRPIDLHRCA